MTPELAIFDCDGVLVDSERMEVGTLAEALTWVGSTLDAVALHERRQGGVLAELLAIVADDLGEPLPDWFVPRYRELQLDRLRSVAPVPGAPEAVADAVAAGWARCVVSGGPMAKMEVSLQATGMWTAFAPHLYSCYDLGDHKPSPGIYRHALEVFGVEPERSVTIEDSVIGVTAAAAAGVPVIGLARDTPAEALRAAGATTTVDHMARWAETVASLPER